MGDIVGIVIVIVMIVVILMLGIVLIVIVDCTCVHCANTMMGSIDIRPKKR